MDNRIINIAETTKLSTDAKYIRFLKWLVDNGAILGHTQYPTVYGEKLIGVSATENIPPCTVLHLS